MNDSVTKHADLPPSSADKWVVCHGWLKLNRGIPNTSSAAADEGTLAHSYLEKAITEGFDLASLDNEEMFDALSMCMEWLEKQPGTKHAELRMDFGEEFGFVDLFGTSDLVIDDEECLTVADLKYGKGLVEAPENYQLLIYLLAAVRKFGTRKKYRLVILQPRANHFDGPIREWTFGQNTLDAFRIVIGEAIHQNYNRGTPTVGAHCRKYCKAQGSCPALAEHSLHLFRTTPV